MRQILTMCSRMAIADAKQSIQNPTLQQTRIQALEAAYRYLDQALSDPMNTNGKLVMEAMATADFALYFGDAVSRSFYADYPTRAGSWADYTTDDETPDFRPVERGRWSEFGTLQKRSERGEATQDTVRPSLIDYQVEEYSNAFGLSWRVLVNDDLAEVRNFPTKLLNAATRFEDTFVSNLYDNATAQAALTSLGSAYTQNLPLTVNGVIAAWEAFAGRTDAQGNPLNITPRFIVTAPVKQLQVQEILAGLDISSTSPAIRATKGLLTWKADPYIGDPDNWYLFADPADIATVTVARMRGYDRPQVYMKAPNMIPFAGGSPQGGPVWTMGDFEHGELYFMVLDIIGGWDDPTYQGITDYKGIFWSSNT